MKSLEKMLQIIELITGVMYVFAAIAICVLFLLMFGDLSGRFLFNIPIKGSVEVSEYLLVAIAFLSLGYAQLQGCHIRMETLISRFPERLRLSVNIFVLLLAIGFFVVMTVQIAERSYLDWVEKILLPITVVPLPVWWQSFIAAVGCALLITSLLVQLIRDIVKLSSTNQGR